MITNKLLELSGKEVAKILLSYFGVRDYFRTKLITGKNRHNYDDSKDFWKDCLGPYYSYPGEKPLASRIIKDGDRIKLEGMDISEWFPLFPGAGYATELSYRSYKKGDVQNFLTKRVYSGWGSIRLSIHNEYKLVSATSVIYADFGIPLIVSSRAFDKIKKMINNEGVVNADIEGIYLSIPHKLKYIFGHVVGVPRMCIYVGSSLLIKNIKPGGNTLASAWTLYETEKMPQLISMCFDVSSEDSIKNTVQRILSEAHRLNATYFITDFDEIIPRVKGAKYPPSVIFSKNFNLQEAIHQAIGDECFCADSV